MILDSSVAAKWCLPDEATPAAERLLHRYRSGDIELLVPDLFWPEMANLLAKATRAGRLTETEGARGLEILHGLRLPVLATQALTAAAYAAACSWRRPAYDLFYVLLAREHEDSLITADERLVRALGHRYPVRSLASLSEW